MSKTPSRNRVSELRKEEAGDFFAAHNAESRTENTKRQNGNLQGGSWFVAELGSLVNKQHRRDDP
jgi:hypothetical protein